MSLMSYVGSPRSSPDVCMLDEGTNVMLRLHGGFNWSFKHLNLTGTSISGKAWHFIILDSSAALTGLSVNVSLQQEY